MSENKKIKLGQFFTKGELWLKPQVKDFIINSGMRIAYDPFAGAGDILNCVKNCLEITDIKGLDIDTSLNWDINDSLVSIPRLENAIIVTNPPYLAKYSASRKKLGEIKYFADSEYEDLYLIALDRMLDSQDFVVAIIPETFINSVYKRKNRLVSITVLEENPFDDTDCPVVVACFDNKQKPFNQISIYKNSSYTCLLSDIENNRLITKNIGKITFNDKNGWLAVRCVDSTDPKMKLQFGYKKDIPYDWDNGIKVSSRLFTLISVDIKKSDRDSFIKRCNKILDETREASFDLVFSPFKGNMKNGVRRRRLDFYTCRAIIERVLEEMNYA